MWSNISQDGLWHCSHSCLISPSLILSFFLSFYFSLVYSFISRSTPSFSVTFSFDSLSLSIVFPLQFSSPFIFIQFRKSLRFSLPLSSLLLVSSPLYPYFSIFPFYLTSSAIPFSGLLISLQRTFTQVNKCTLATKLSPNHPVVNLCTGTEHRCDSATRDALWHCSQVKSTMDSYRITDRCWINKTQICTGYMIGL